MNTDPYSSDIVTTVTEALQLNRELQEGIRKELLILEQLERKVVQLEKLQKRVDHGKIPKNQLLIVKRKPPFFIDKHQCTPPPNSDMTIEKSIPELVYGPKSWSLTEKEELRKEVLRENQMIHSNYGQVEIETTEAELLTFMEGINWTNIARPIQGRSPIECQIQWTVHDHPYINHTPFTEEEKSTLATVIERHDARNWQLIAQEHGNGRVAWQCFQIYQREMNPKNVNRMWTAAEDKILIEAVQMCGTGDWIQVSSFLPGRTSAQCLQRYQRSLVPGRRKGKWTEEEDHLLMRAIESFGKNWTRVAAMVRTRTDVQCRERYENCLNPELNFDPITEEEKSQLISLVQQLGIGSWSHIAGQMKGRTDAWVAREWKRLSKKRGPSVELNDYLEMASQSSPMVSLNTSPSNSSDRAGSTEALTTKKRKGNSTIADMDRKYRQRCTDINKWLCLSSRNPVDEKVTPCQTMAPTLLAYNVLNRLNEELQFTQESDIHLAPSNDEKEEIGRQMLKNRLHAIFAWPMMTRMYKDKFEKK